MSKVYYEGPIEDHEGRREERGNFSRWGSHSEEYVTFALSESSLNSKQIP